MVINNEDALGMQAMHDRFTRHRPTGYETNGAVVCICTALIRAYLSGYLELLPDRSGGRDGPRPRLTAASVSRFVTISAACADSERWRTIGEASLLGAGVLYVILKTDNLLSDHPQQDWNDLCFYFRLESTRCELPTAASVEVAILSHVDWNVCSPQTAQDWVRVLSRGGSYFGQRDASYVALLFQLNKETMCRCHPAAIALAAVMVSKYRVSHRVVKQVAVATRTTPTLMWTMARRIARVNGWTRAGLRSAAREGNSISSSGA